MQPAAWYAPHRTLARLRRDRMWRVLLVAGSQAGGTALLLDTRTWTAARQWDVPQPLACGGFLRPGGAQLAVFADSLRPAVRLSLYLCPAHGLPCLIQVGPHKHLPCGAGVHASCPLAAFGDTHSGWKSQSKKVKMRSGRAREGQPRRGLPLPYRASRRVARLLAAVAVPLRLAQCKLPHLGHHDPAAPAAPPTLSVAPTSATDFLPADSPVITRRATLCCPRWLSDAIA